MHPEDEENTQVDEAVEGAPEPSPEPSAEPEAPPKRKRASRGERETGPLTDKQLDVLRSMSLGETNREIAQALGVSVKTVETHRAYALKKLGAKTTAHAIRLAFEAGVLP